jgi:hypothetical protein
MAGDRAEPDVNRSHRRQRARIRRECLQAHEGVCTLRKLCEVSARGGLSPRENRPSRR